MGKGVCRPLSCVVARPECEFAGKKGFHESDSLSFSEWRILSSFIALRPPIDISCVMLALVFLSLLLSLIYCQGRGGMGGGGETAGGLQEDKEEAYDDKLSRFLVIFPALSASPISV